jgi:Flp pilus assembly pilin Flp
MSGRKERLLRQLSAALRGDGGQALTEYALVIALLAVIAGAVTLATGIGPTIISHIQSALDSVKP